MAYSYYVIIAFYVILIGFFMGVGATVAKAVRNVAELSGFVIGAFVGLFVSYYLWLNYGKKMIMAR